ncbi:cobaltochelatase subunit CobN [Roseinatronobacter bogoriensis]|uniref:Cobaltochelatase subunit CobN n=1 Tax=Roseinatronobacter bogoriensis subsp. barguzinensis TaxID=441209 RepID=A0A2K8KCT4_9RHOB|nr:MULTISPECIES: cobaltochelatase subunit CobN [Rhodobaca]ATX67257.1 cobaltochelatase subunit CobN [Rhodobaca barguzinensis]MBB4206809.1 cobaltochelatase CobN [Rhodobaca bogoriensis DSM 18756]TDW41553.1 cobaltochelatase CobN [Rhodobaca barguzinensis]TDY74269.1 cobaltochelatase CobN subunit [Rhodobaca bogoriensis DSM 18756]
MHVIFRESYGLDEADTPTDLGQSPADLVVLSFSDSDLGAFAAGWRASEGALPTVRLANLAALKHPLSVDTYVENTLEGAKGILIRLIGGAPYWSYGLQQVQAMARQKCLALAVLPADGRDDPALDAASTLPISTLRRLKHLCDMGGAVAAQAALQQLALAAGLYAPPVRGARVLPQVGGWGAQGVTCPAAFALNATRKRILITFYRSYLAAADLAPIRALAAGLEARGFDVLALFVPSLKEPQARAWLTRWIGALSPRAVVNATAFSAQGEDGAVLEAAGVPVFQVALATNERKRWRDAARGLSPADLAMHVVLPEVDGRIFAGVASFKEFSEADPELQFSRAEHCPEPARIDAIAARVAAWVRLQDMDAHQKRVALVLSTYPGKGWNMAHAVGLDALESASAILQDLGADAPDARSLADRLAQDRLHWPIEYYRAALDSLPQPLRDDLATAWGRPEDDPAFDGTGFTFAALRIGANVIALQPERGTPALRDDEYHDLGRTPRHGYVAFYLWLRAQADALVHIGAHGTLEWLPGKSVALSDDCWPEALVRDMPVIYPFIVNDPGEAAQAKRRIGAVTLGHVPPPMVAAQSGAGLAQLEALLDEFSNADGLDPARRDRLQDDIRTEAEALGLGTELGLDGAECLAEAITRIDRFVCDVKESQFGDGLHVFGRGDQGAGERAGLQAALSGRFVPPGPSGSPHRGRSDVLPTGRNMFTTDPRAVPSRAAYAQGVKLADELVRRHLQDHGDWPRALVVDLWGSATMRTAGEEFAMALHLLGARPVWDEGSSRVSGVEILPIAELDRPRLDVTLRVSGLFRDVFPQLSTLFGQAVAALAARDEAPDWNPFVRQGGARVYGPAPGSYGLGMGSMLEDYSADAREQAGRAWLEASSHAIDTGQHDPDGIAARVAAADAFVHLQDLPETDLLLAQDYAAHEAGFAAAQALTGGKAALYHMDATRPDDPRARSLSEEIARVVRARAANPTWIAGMMKHGFRGGAEIAATLEHLAAFAHLAQAVPPQLFDLYHDATLGQEDVRDFLARENPDALAAMEARFAALHEAGLWVTRRNSILAGLNHD